MNIGFDATAILGPMSKNRGIGNYGLSLFKTLINKDKENQYYMLNFFEESNMEKKWGNIENFEEVYMYTGKDRFLLSDPEYKKILGEIIKRFIKEKSIDVYYITSPFDNSIVIYEKEWLSAAKVVAIVYDIIPYIFRKRYLPGKKDLQWYMSCVDVLKFVDRCLAISQSVKTDMVRYLNFSEKKIDVIWGASSEKFYKVDISESERVELYNKFGIVDNFIMCTGGDDERKNLAGLIDAYSKIRRDLIEKYQLVIVCKLSAGAEQVYAGQAQHLGLKNRVILTNFVSDDELLKLYNLATALVFPSKYEGFGLPVVEAFACETPVVTSNNSSLVEIAGEAAVLVDPFDIKDVSRGIEEILTSDNCKELISKGLERLREFNWPKVADNVIASIKKLDNVSRPQANKKKIAFFTPLPPIESGISDYSVDILNELSKYTGIDVYIDDGYEEKCQLADNISVYNHKKFEASLYDIIIYQVGNSHYHAYMYDYIVNYPGVVVLHDYNMHSVAQYEALFFRKNDIELYGRYLSYDYDESIVNDVLDRIKRTGQIPTNYSDMELNGFITNYAKKIIVHSNEAHEKLLRKDISRIIKTIRHYAKIGEISDKFAIRKEMGYTGGEIIIASFGHIHKNKRALQILKAVGLLCKKYDNLTYVFAGKLDEGTKSEFNDIVFENGLQKRVKVTGYINLDLFEKYIDITDICVNLRWPYNGETSGSLMRILAKGKCVLVNDIGSFAEIPDDACVKLPSVESMTEDEEVSAIYNALENLISNEERRKELSTAARKYAQEYLNLKKIVEEYWNFCGKEQEKTLDEEIIKKIGMNEIENKNYTYEECEQLSETLAYLK